MHSSYEENNLSPALDQLNLPIKKALRSNYAVLTLLLILLQRFLAD